MTGAGNRNVLCTGKAGEINRWQPTGLLVFAGRAAYPSL